MHLIKKRKVNIIAVSAIILTLFCAYLPLLSVFSLRNDQTNYFLPVRMYMSDAFNHHEYMFWNPFMSGSYPIHSDMQGPVWNPIVIAFSWLFDYNSSLLSVEILLYYVIGAIGCFFFAKNFTSNLYSRFIIAISYGCGGFASSTMEFMGWVASFAFLPWAFHYFYRILKRKTYLDTVKLAIWLWALITSGYPSFLIFLGYAFAGSFACYIYLLHSRKKDLEILPVIKCLFVSFALFVIFSLPAIHSYLEYLPYYPRGNKATTVQLNAESFSFSYPLSFIFPGCGNSWDNNIYIGLLPFLLLCRINLKRASFTLRNNFLIIAWLFTFLFTLGRSTPFRMWCADYIPLLGKFGFSHSVRIFLVFPIYIWLIPKLNILFSDQRSSYIKKIRSAAIIAGIILLSYLILNFNHTNFRTDLVRLFYYTSACWQLFFISILIFSSKIYASVTRICFIIALDLIISVFTVAPITGLSKTSSFVYNHFASDFYKTNTNDLLLLPEKRDKSLLEIDSHSEINALKLIPRNDFPSNTRNETFRRFLQDTSNFNFLFAKPFIFALDNSDLKIQNFELGYNFINAKVFTKNSCYAIIQQTFHPRWRSQYSEHRVTNYKGILLKIKLDAGENKLRLYYYKTDLQIEYLISLSALLFTVLYIFIQYKKHSKLSHLY
jgi:hypothetical protein